MLLKQIWTLTNTLEITTFISAWRGYLVGQRFAWHPYQRNNLLGYRKDIMIASPVQHLYQFRRVVELLQAMFKFEGKLWTWGMLRLPKHRMLLPEDFKPVHHHWGQVYCVWHSGHFSNHVQVLRFRRFCRRRRPRRRQKLEQRRRLPSRRVYRLGRKVRQRWRRLRRHGSLPARCYRLGGQTTRVINHSCLISAAYVSAHLRNQNYANQAQPHSSIRVGNNRIIPPSYPLRGQNYLDRRVQKIIRWVPPRNVQNYLIKIKRNLHRVYQFRRNKPIWFEDFTREVYFGFSRWLPFRQKSILHKKPRFNFLQGRRLRQIARFNFAALQRLNNYTAEVSIISKRSSRVGLKRLQRSLWIGGFTQRYRVFRRRKPRRRGRKIQFRVYQSYRSQPTVLPAVTAAGGLTFRQQAFLTETKAISVPFIWFCGANVKPNFTPWTVLWNQEKMHTEGLFFFFDEVWANTQQMLLMRLVVTRLSLVG